MAKSTYVKNFTHGTVTLIGGATPTPLELELECDNGDISVSGLVDGLHEIIKYERRGRLKSVARGTRVYPSGSLTAMFSQFTDATTGCISDFLSIKAGSAFAARVGTMGAAPKPDTIDIKIQIEGTDFGDDFDHTFTMEDCRVSLDWSEGDPDTWSLSWEILGAITGDVAYSQAA